MGLCSYYYYYILLLILFLCSLTPSISLSSVNESYNNNNTIIPISFFNPKIPPHSDPFQRLTNLASISIARAHHLKNPKNAPASSTTTPVHPFSGGYAISLSFGTPPQTIPMIMDTGSSFSWFPCTQRYACKNCSSTTGIISPFIPKKSSSARIVGCMNPKCGWVHKSFDPVSSCNDCDGVSRKNCTQICPPYVILYGLGSTGGLAMIETLNMNHEKVENFLVGCSLFSSNQPAGVAGFGRGISSLPNQLGVRRFSYCLVSHRFDNTPKSSLLFMDRRYDSGLKSKEFSYTPFLKNPVKVNNSALSEYYYVGLKRITVGVKKVKVSYQESTSDSSKGNGGTIVDSGSTFTYMNNEVYNHVANAFAEQVKEYKRAENVESVTGLRPCFDVTGQKSVEMPEMKLHFKGGAKMNLPLENYFFAVSDGKKMAVCLTVVTDNTMFGSEMINGPSIILGNFLMQNFRVEYDLRNDRFGFKKESCS